MRCLCQAKILFFIGFIGTVLILHDVMYRRLRRHLYYGGQI
jgi:hypothetical protein